jgi:hypothetical protein
MPTNARVVSGAATRWFGVWMPEQDVRLRKLRKQSWNSWICWKCEIGSYLVLARPVKGDVAIVLIKDNLYQSTPNHSLRSWDDSCFQTGVMWSTNLAVPKVTNPKHAFVWLDV